MECQFSRVRGDAVVYMAFMRTFDAAFKKDDDDDAAASAVPASPGDVGYMRVGTETLDVYMRVSVLQLLRRRVHTVRPVD